MHILQEHYTQTIISLMEHIQVFKDPEWTVALKWAKKRFKHKLTENTIKYCSSTIQNKQSTFETRQGPISYATAHTASPPQTVSHSTHQHPPSSPVLPTGDPTHASKREILVTAQVHHRQVSPVQSLKSTITVVKKTNSPSYSLYDHTGETMAKSQRIRMRGHANGNSSQTGTRSESFPPSLLPAPSSPSLPLPIPPSSQLPIVPPFPCPTSSHSTSLIPISSMAMENPNDSSSDSSGEHILDKISHRNTPYRHINTVKKRTDWSITIHQPVVFIGDSNLSRIPSIPVPNVQVDSFPGAKFSHLASILSKLSTHPHTQKVVLAAGLNNIEQHPQKTAIKQLQGLWRDARRTFPNATIYTPIINFSDSLSTFH
ncbi:hypothetical protein Q7C36_011161 [Tachysurus vachellii]|uniref:Uncharacterized protein n=1 Tax=Tachysurus vachellii TaxID=175792 RepID=A0AA88MW85_TACVA|nr:hypothetical protein Q7C36_011161 [Tachysurus vachellii]